MVDAEFTFDVAAEEEARLSHERDVLSAYLRLFTSADGEVVLADLEETFHSETSHVPGDPYTSAWREGQRAVVISIKDVLKNFKNEHASKPEEEEQE